MTTAATILLAIGAIVSQPTDVQSSGTLAINLLLVLFILAPLLYCCVDVGYRFAEEGKNYWVRGYPQEPLVRFTLSGAASVLSILIYTGFICRFFHVVLSRDYPGDLRAIVHLLAGNIAFVSAEEIIYRGCFQSLLGHFLRLSRYNRVLAICCVSVIFAAQHVGPSGLATMAMAFPVGVLLGYIFDRYGLILAIVVHLVSNLLLVFWLPTIVAHL
jgi:membrane protease YdiL (CAAX protease family)